MKKKLAWVVLLATLMAALFGFVACGGGTGDEKEEPGIEYAGTYQLRTINYLGFELELGKGGVLGFLTKDLAKLTLTEDRRVTFNCDIALLKFNVSGTWEVDKTDEEKLTATVKGAEEVVEKLAISCNGKTLVVSYMDATFTLEK